MKNKKKKKKGLIKLLLREVKEDFLLTGPEFVSHRSVCLWTWFSPQNFFFFISFSAVAASQISLGSTFWPSVWLTRLWPVLCLSSVSFLTTRFLYTSCTTFKYFSTTPDVLMFSVFLGACVFFLLFFWFFFSFQIYNFLRSFCYRNKTSSSAYQESLWSLFDGRNDFYRPRCLYYSTTLQVYVFSVVLILDVGKKLFW